MVVLIGLRLNCFYFQFHPLKQEEIVNLATGYQVISEKSDQICLIKCDH